MMKVIFRKLRSLARLGVLITALAAFCGASAAEGVKLSAWRPLAAQYDLYYNDNDLLSRQYSPFVVDNKSGGFPVFGGGAIVPLLGKLLVVALVAGAAVHATKDSKAASNPETVTVTSPTVTTTVTLPTVTMTVTLPTVTTTVGYLEVCMADSTGALNRRVLARATGTWRAVNFGNFRFNLADSLQKQVSDNPSVRVNAFAMINGINAMVRGDTSPLSYMLNGVATAPKAGDVLEYVRGGAGENVGFLADATRKFRLYTASTGGSDLFLAPEVDEDGQRSCTTALDVDSDGDSSNNFFLSSVFVASAVYYDDNLRFRRDNLHGLIDPDTAIQLGDFLFAADSQLQNIHMENRSELFVDDDFSLLSASGFIRQDGGKTSVIYSKITALKALTPQVDVYAQTSHGRVNSELYNDAALSGLSFGIFAEQIFRWDDSAHLGLERRFADVAEELWQLSANMQIGGEESRVYFGFNHDLQGGGTQANIMYRRQF